MYQVPATWHLVVQVTFWRASLVWSSHVLRGALNPQRHRAGATW